MKNYTKKQIAEIAPLPPRQVQFYTEQGAVIPEDDKGEGRGKVRRYSQKNLLEFMVIKELFDYGMTVGKVKIILKSLSNLRSIGLLDTLTLGASLFLQIFKKPDGTMKLVYNPVRSWRWVDDEQKIQKAEDRRKEKLVLSLDKMQGYSACLVIDLGALIRRVKES